MVNKTVNIILSVLLVSAGVIFFSLDKDSDNETFNYCEEQPLFGLKYQNCNDAACANFYEGIKQNLQMEYCE